MPSSLTINLKEDADIKYLSKSIKITSSFDDLKLFLTKINDNLEERFIQNEAIENLVYLRSHAIDQIMLHLWSANKLDNFSDIALIAVGGYGRGELHPQSDVDIMILSKTKITAKANDHISIFLTNLWDLGFDLGHSVRSLKECKTESKKI